MTTPGPSPIRVVLLDIEGTTTPIAFVHDTLFSFARERLDAWFSDQPSAATGAVVRALHAEYRVDAVSSARASLPPWRAGPPDEEQASAIAYVRWLMDRDRKSPALKALQGLIWEEGYQAGRLRGVVFDDVPRAITRWRAQAVEVAIYSSGSELAQRRLFSTAGDDDLTPLMAGFFDTRVGAKRESESYTRIAGTLGRQPDEVLFVSDVVEELDAAAEAGCRTCLSVRPGNPDQRGAERFWSVTSFDEILPEGKAGA